MSTPIADPKSEPGRQTYRGCLVERQWVTHIGAPWPDEWQWWHPDRVDYSEDKGPIWSGNGCTVAECREAIDEYYAEREVASR